MRGGEEGEIGHCQAKRRLLCEFLPSLIPFLPVCRHLYFDLDYFDRLPYSIGANRQGETLTPENRDQSYVPSPFPLLIN
jgi:hypothetical protein